MQNAENYEKTGTAAKVSGYLDTFAVIIRTDGETERSIKPATNAKNPAFSLKFSNKGV